MNSSPVGSVKFNWVIKDFYDKMNQIRLDSKSYRLYSESFSVDCDGERVEFKLLLEPNLSSLSQQVDLFIFKEGRSDLAVKYVCECHGKTRVGQHNFHKKSDRSLGSGLLLQVQKILTKLIRSGATLTIKIDMTVYHTCERPSRKRKALEMAGTKIRKQFKNDSEMNDLVIEAQGRRIPCNRAILALHSDVFMAMFYRSPSSEAQSGVVNIPDFSPEAVEKMLEFLYTGECQNLDQNALEVLKLCDKYDLPTLKNDCAETLSSNLKVENAAQVLFTAQMVNARALFAKTVAFVKANFEGVANTPEWKEGVADNISQIFKQILK